MLKKLPDKVIEILTTGSPDQRKYVCFRDLGIFARYYFSEYFLHPPAPFHFDFYEDIDRIVKGELDEAAWIAFGESAKTTIAKIAVTWLICYADKLEDRAKRYINWDSYDKDNAEAALFDIATTLQTNRKLIADFGQLYWKQKTETDMRESQKKSVASFITSNNVKMEAFSTQESPRGRVWRARRPDLFVLDDIENNKTKVSYALTKKIKDHVDEVRRGLGATGAALYLGNYIVEDGVIDYVRGLIIGTGRGIVRDIPVMVQDEPTWPGKYERWDRDAAIANRGILDRRRRKVSIEHKQRTLTDRVFQPEMMNNPGASGDYFFNRERIKELRLKAKNPVEEIAGLKIWSKFNAKYAFGIGADTSEGKGLDSNADVIINFTRRPAIVSATYESNLITPDLFAYELERHGKVYALPVLGVESNNTGYATLAMLQAEEIAYPFLYVREVKNRTTGKMAKEFGFRMTSAVKYDLFTSLKSAVEDGELEILDAALLDEAYHFRLLDLHALHMEEGMTRHFDKLTACAIAWEMRKWAKLPKDGDSKYQNPQQDKYQV